MPYLIFYHCVVCTALLIVEARQQDFHVYLNNFFLIYGVFVNRRRHQKYWAVTVDDLLSRRDIMPIAQDLDMMRMGRTSWRLLCIEHGGNRIT